MLERERERERELERCVHGASQSTSRHAQPWVSNQETQHACVYRVQSLHHAFYVTYLREYVQHACVPRSCSPCNVSDRRYYQTSLYGVPLVQYTYIRRLDLLLCWMDDRQRTLFPVVSRDYWDSSIAIDPRVTRVVSFQTGLLNFGELRGIG